jgi:regulator of sirC expression with transglutaminase-like and TPR domain
MTGFPPIEAPGALEYFAALVADDASFPLMEAAVAVAQDDDRQLDVQGVLDELDTLAERLRRRLPADAAPLARLRLLNRYFFDELGFAGNVNDYHDPRNSFVPAVLATRRGIPLTLSLIYIEIATQIGLRASGISFPGHFLVKLHMPRGEVVIDAFCARSLSREELEDRLQPFREQRGLVGSEEVPLGLYLQTAAPRDVIARLLRNLKGIHQGAGDWPRLVSVLQRLVTLLPEDWDERRDHALALAQIGHRERAADELDVYLRHRPNASDARALRRELAAWRRAC